jgi:hypothetical protein
MMRLHLEGAFGDEDIVYQASCAIRRDAPNFFSSTMLGVATSFDHEGENSIVISAKDGPEKLEERYLPLPLSGVILMCRFDRIGKW